MSSPASKSRSRTTDWVALKAEYASGTMTLRQLASTHGLSESSVFKRSSREKWDAERQSVSAQLAQKAINANIDSRVSEVAEFNKADLTMARSIRAIAGQMIADAQRRLQILQVQASQQPGVMPPAFPLSASELRSISGAVAEAQKVGRLALGLSTANNEHAGPDGGPIPTAEVPLSEAEIALAEQIRMRLRAKYGEDPEAKQEGRDVD